MNILIVDDDEMIRNWLKLFLSQIRHTINVVFEASDGLEALDICREQAIDLVITDVKMPRMDGTELIQKLLDLHPKIRVAVLSSYDDFNFVRTALKHGAIDYILKPEMQLDDIRNLLDKTVKDLQIEKSLTTQDPASYAKIIQRQHILHRYVDQASEPSADGLTDIPDGDILALFDEPAHLDGMCVGLFSALAPEGSTNLAISDIACERIAGEHLNGFSIPWMDDLHLILYQCVFLSQEDQHRNYIRLMSVIDQGLERHLGTTIQQSINLICQESDKLQTKIREAMEIMDSVIYYASSERKTTHHQGLFTGRKSLIHDLQIYLDQRQVRDANNLLKTYLQQAHEHQISPVRIKRDLLTALNVYLTHTTQSTEPSAFEDLIDRWMAKIQAATDATTVQNELNHFCQNFIDLYRSCQTMLSTSVLEAVNFIENNFQNRIGLEDVARHVNLSRSYFSQLFSKEKGLPFCDYLENVRIQKAKILLKSTHYSVSDIASAVGFSNQNYFTKVFKNATGYSPLQFKKV